MDRQSQIDFILDHYEAPRGHGVTNPADVVMQGGNPGCGDIVTIYVQTDGSEQITGLSFEGEGCTISQAATSMVMEMFAGKTLADIENSDSNVIIDLLGREIATTRLRCATLGLTTTQNAVNALRRQRMAAAHGVSLPQDRATGSVPLGKVEGA